MGDPGGIGPEVIVKALADQELRARGRYVVFGLHEAMSQAAHKAGIQPYWFNISPADIGEIQSGVVVADYGDELPMELVSSSPTLEGGQASIRFLDDAIDAHKNRIADAIVTGPIHKIAWKMAKIKQPGHTEYIADAYRCRRVTMAFVGGNLRVALASTHVGIFELQNSFTIGRVFQPIDLLDDWLRRYCGVEKPRIAVCGLNPHAGEDGRFGDEEKRIIEPAIIMAGELGIQVDGPFPADTLFVEAARGSYDGVVAMYHDQGLIPMKLLHFDSSVNVTLGLPVIRTSVDHGTAFNIAGLNRANPGSMKAAISLACGLVGDSAKQSERNKVVPARQV